MKEMKNWSVKKFYETFQKGRHVRLIFSDEIIDDVIQDTFDFNQDKSRGYYAIDLAFQSTFIQLMLNDSTKEIKIYDCESDVLYSVECFVD